MFFFVIWLVLVSVVSPESIYLPKYTYLTFIINYTFIKYFLGNIYFGKLIPFKHSIVKFNIKYLEWLLK